MDGYGGRFIGVADIVLGKRDEALHIVKADAVGECAVLVAYSEYDAVLLTETCLRRLEMLGSLMGTADTVTLNDAFVSRYGRVVVLSALPDNSSARAIFKKIA